jgi:tRNA (cmo5U34)-methyltransferase|tara:strand:- start:1077 stop:1826 length:750 start_codon:yes stop_codon:yes gene_type:complete
MNNRQDDVNKGQDKVFAEPLEQVGAFKFDAQVADVFENMINRSVPGYPLILDMIGVLTERFAQSHSNCYDLGCSLGASTLKIRQHMPADSHLIAVDDSAAMIDRCRANIERDHSQASTEILQQSIQDTEIDNASIVVMNFTLQFIADPERPALLKRIADGMSTGGALILSEKLIFDDEDEQRFQTELHHDFKRYQGYSDLEVAQKRASLENVLIPNSIEQHIDRLSSAGFREVRMIVRCLNFASFLAIR